MSFTTGCTTGATRRSLMDQFKAMERRFGSALTGEVCPATAAHRSHKRQQAPHHETSDGYVGQVVQVCDRWRVITCRDHLQWILQRRDAQRSGQPRWTGVRYFQTREALVRTCRTLCERVDPAAMAMLLALPERIGGA